MKTLQNYVDAALKSGDFSKLEKYCLSEEYQALPYAEKNAPFITSSKLKMFAACQHSYKLMYVDRVPVNWRVEELGAKPEAEPDYFVVGSALDYLLTYGQEAFDETHIKVERRVSDFDGAIEMCEQTISQAVDMYNKDGSRSKPGINAEMKATQRIVDLNILRDKVQLTDSMFNLIEQMKAEFFEQEQFNHSPKKRVFFYQVAGFILKAELDDFDDKVIRDVKTTANVLTFDPEFYVGQAAFYQWLVQENTGNLLPVQLEVVDKYSSYARSELWAYRDSTLQEARGRFLSLLSTLRDAHDTGIFARSTDRNVLFNSPYYGYQGYGRPTEPRYY